jgi:hypothetical protein
MMQLWALSAGQTTLFYWLVIILSRPACYWGQNLVFAINHKAWIGLIKVFLVRSVG